jgi:hypothetical protein
VRFRLGGSQEFLKVSGGSIGYTIHGSRSHDAVIRVSDDAGDMIETHEHKRNFKEW